MTELIINKIDFEAVDERLWRAAVRSRLPDYPCVNTLNLKKKLFDSQTQMGVVAAMNILTQTIDSYKWPENWAEAIKERWFPNWLKKIFPVRYTRIKISAIYPKAKLSDPIFKATPWAND